MSDAIASEGTDTVGVTLQADGNVRIVFQRDDDPPSQVVLYTMWANRAHALVNGVNVDLIAAGMLSASRLRWPTCDFAAIELAVLVFGVASLGTIANPRAKA